MAAVSGDQKQKLFVLAGFLGVLVLVGFFALRRSTPAEPLEATTALAAPPTGTGSVAPTTAKPVVTKAPEKAAKAPDTKQPKAVLVKAPIIPPIETARLAESRTDPFEPFYHPTPEPTATPTPLPPPVDLPAPPTVSLPSPQLASAPPNSVLIGLPRPRVAGYAPLPGPIWSRASTPKAPADLQIRSANKRLSGVIIGDSVRALLEITMGDNAAGGGAEGANGAAATNTIVRVVQPGDEVDGIKILRIERVYEGGRQVTRMFIREGNEERYVDLRASPNPPAAAAGGALSEGGSPGASGSGSFGAIRPAPRSFQRGGGSPPPAP